jgi:hypothetical protein
MLSHTVIRAVLPPGADTPALAQGFEVNEMKTPVHDPAALTVPITEGYVRTGTALEKG